MKRFSSSEETVEEGIRHDESKRFIEIFACCGFAQCFSVVVSLQFGRRSIVTFTGLIVWEISAAVVRIFKRICIFSRKKTLFRGLFAKMALFTKIELFQRKLLIQKIALSRKKIHLLTETHQKRTSLQKWLFPRKSTFQQKLHFAEQKCHSFNFS